MIDLLITMAALVVAIFWVGYQQRELTKTLKRLKKTEQRLHSAKLTLSACKDANEYLKNNNEFMGTILMDVAKGEANVWIDDNGELIAARTPAGNTSVH